MIYGGEWAFSHPNSSFLWRNALSGCWGSIQQENMHAYELRAVAALQMEPIPFCSWFLAKILPFAASSQAKNVLLSDGSQSHQTLHGGSNAHQG